MSQLDSHFSQFSSLVIPNELKDRGVKLFNTLRKYTKKQNVLIASLYLELYISGIYKEKHLMSLLLNQLPEESLQILKEFNLRMEESIFEYFSLEFLTVDYSSRTKWLRDIFKISSNTELLISSLCLVFVKDDMWKDDVEKLLELEADWIYPELKEEIQNVCRTPTIN